MHHHVWAFNWNAHSPEIFHCLLLRLGPYLYLLQFLTQCPIHMVFPNGAGFNLCNSNSIILPFYGSLLIKEKKKIF